MFVHARSILLINLQAGIEAARFTDNVASFLSQRLSMRPDIERQLLFAVACFGTEAPLNLLRHALQMQQVQFDVRFS